MSAKKKEKNYWVQCENCNQSFIVKSKHECGDTGVSFVEEKLFCGYAKAYDENIDGKLPSTRNNFILINQSTLKVCNFQVASTVVVTVGNKKTFGTIWPSQNVSLDSIHLSLSKFNSLECTIGDMAFIKKVTVPSITAKSIVINQPEKVDLDELKLLLAEELDNTLISKGDLIYITLNGICNKIFISDILTDLSEELSQLTISDPEKCIPYLFLSDCSIDTIVPFEEKEEIDATTKTLFSFGGLKKQLKVLNDSITIPFSSPNLFADHGIHFRKGLILYGPSGTGKTLLCRAFLEQQPALFKSTINGPELTSKYFGETEEKLRQIFKSAIEKAPAVLIIDEFDTVCPKRTSSSNESEKRIVATLCTLMDSIPENANFVVIGLTNKIEEIDPALRRPGRFEKEIEFTVPNTAERLEIIEYLLKGRKHCLMKSDIQHLSEITHGYVGADLSALCKEAGAIYLQEALKSAGSISSVESFLNNNSLSLNSFKEALCLVSPSALKAMTVDVPKVYWTDVGGQNEVKQKLRESIEWPLKHPEAFVRLGIKPPRGLLMYGPPGCSKTMMAKALATESSLNFISIKGPELFNKYLGESELAVREVFRKARLSAPSIVFFDEIDALGVQRSGKENSAGDKVLAQLLTELDGVESLDGVIVIAATNRPDIIDPALVRPGRIDRMIYVPLPDDNTRLEILQIQFRKMPVDDTINILSLVELTNSYSGAEICSICQEAGLLALRENIEAIVITEKHFREATRLVKPGTSLETIRFYDNFASRRS